MVLLVIVPTGNDCNRDRENILSENKKKQSASR